MAEEDAVGLEALVAQRIKRPSYARMISWEFQSTGSAEPVHSRRRRRKSKKQSFSEEDRASDNSDGSETEVSYKSDEEMFEESKDIMLSDSDGDSVYLSAEEIVLSGDSDGEVTKKLSATTLHGDKNDSVEEEDLSPVSLSQGHKEDVDDSSKKSRKIKIKERYRAPSKKQKRKKRRMDNFVIHGDNILPFFDAEVIPDIIVESNIADSMHAMITKTVPSLVELCLASTRTHSKAVFFPYGIRPTVRDSNYIQSFKKFQISWLQSLLASLGAKTNIEYQLGLTMTARGGEEYVKYIFAGRNIWNKTFFAESRSSWNVLDYNYGENTSFLRFTYANSSNIIANDYYLGGTGVRLYRVLGVLGSLIDLMMPSMVSDRIGSRQRSESELDKLKKAMETIMIRVKGALRLRFETLIDMFFNEVIPYVFWARGDVDQATYLFTKHIEIEKSNIKKAMYSSEIGRMYAQHEDPDVACKYYRAASDLAMTKDDMKFSKEANGQMLMLLANCYDQGMMTPYKAKKSADMWSYVVTSPHVFKEGGVPKAAESLLCFHSGTKWDGKTSSFEVAKSRLSGMIDSCPEFLYHLSMIHAFQGAESDSAALYRDFLQRGNKEGQDAPGVRLGVSAVRGRKNNVWGPLCDMVAKCGPPVPLQVLWRVQLQPLVVAKGTIYDADYCTKGLNLRLNTDGYITGDMQTLLPPRRGINLDPYTGAITNVHTPGKTEPWQTIKCHPDEYGNDGYEWDFIPTPLEVYSDEDGIRVQLMKPESDIITNKAIPGVATMFWSNASGEKLKVNITKILDNFIYKTQKQKIMRNKIKQKKSDWWERQMLKVLDSLYEQKRTISYQYIEGEVTRIEEKKKLEKEIAKGEKKPDSRETYPFVADIIQDFRNYQMDKDFVCYGKTLLLHFLYSFYETKLKVFFDCSTKESFATPKLVPDEHDYNTESQKYCNKTEKHRIPGAKILYFPNKEKKKFYIKIFGHGGKFLYQHDWNKDVMGPSEQLSLYIVGDCLVSTTKNKELWVLQDKEVSVNSQFTGIQDLKILCGHVMLVKFEKHLSFVHIPSMELLTMLTITDVTYQKYFVCEENKRIVFAPHTMEVLATRQYSEADPQYTKVMLAVDTILITLTLPSEQDQNMEIQIADAMKFSGYPTDMCFVGDHGGFLVSWTQNATSDSTYREIVSYFNSKSELLGVLPCLGPGPRSFFPLLLPGDPSIQASHTGYGGAGWHVYMRDGHEGILGVKLTDC